MSNYGSLSELMQSQSKSSLRRLTRNPSSASSIGDQASKWDEHVAMTLRRNERIRMQKEASKLRGAFTREDPRLEGVVSFFKVKDCLKAGGVILPEPEMKMILAKYKSSTGKFDWQRFCKGLETGEMPSQSFHPKASMRASSAVLSEDIRGSVSSKFLAAKEARRGLGSQASLSQSSLTHGKSSERLRRMVSEASLVSNSEKSIMSAASWHAKMDQNRQMASAGPKVPQAAPTYAPTTTKAPSVQEEFPYEAPTPIQALPKVNKDDEFKKKKKAQGIISMAEQGLNSRFSDMYKAFQYIDLDRSGRLSREEISRALDLWNIPLDDESLDLLMGQCDNDDDGGVSYEEFVDALARETVSQAAMGKRGMQSKEAMGVDAQEMLAHQLGHGGVAKYDISINAKGKPATKGAAAAPAALVAPAAAAVAAAPKKVNKDDEFKKKKKAQGIISMAEQGLNSRFSDMYKAFQYIDLDRSGRLSREEISRALDLWNIPLDDESLDLLMGQCDNDDDGGVSYEEFVDALARETVSQAAMGKRGMQSKEAMGVDAQEMLAHQLGHGGVAKYDISINAK